MTTQHFGFESFGAEGRISDNGYKFSNRDRHIQDALFFTLFNHDHRAVSTTSIPNPTAYPELTVSTSSGSLAPDTDYYYRISFLDASGNESVASASGFARTGSKLASPGVMVLDTATTGGTLISGTYKYALSYYQASGETMAPNIATIVVPPGTSTNTVTITLDTLPTDATGWKVYRKAPGDAEFYPIKTIAAGPSNYVDTGADAPVCTQRRPTSNTTTSANSITVAIPAQDLPLPQAVTSWRVYRTSTPTFGSRSLAATVVETTTEGGADLVTSWVDTGTALSNGVPLSQTAVPPVVPQLDAGDIWSTSTSPLPSALAPRGVNSWSMLFPGTLTAKTYSKVFMPHDMHVERIDAFFLTAPTGVDGSNYITVRLKDDSLVDEVQSLHNSAVTVDEIQRIWNNATAGTFTLSFSGQGPTAAINYNASAATVETALESLSNITDVFVTGNGTAASPWIVTFLDPGDQGVAEITATDTLTGGSTTIITSVEGSDGGTFTLSDGATTTSAIAYNAAAATVETRLQTDITSITDVNVTGTGTSADPWVIVFVNPGDQDVALLIADDTNLNGVSTIVETTRGRGNSQIDCAMITNDAYQYWQSSTTDYGLQEAETAPATGGVQVSDTLATNDVVMELDTQFEKNTWNIGTLEAGDYVFRFWVSSATPGADFDLIVDDINTTPMATVSVTSDRKAYEPEYEIELTLDGTEDIQLEVEKTDATGNTVRVDRYEYEVVLPRLYQGQLATAEIVVTGAPSTNGGDLQVTVWY